MDDAIDRPRKVYAVESGFFDEYEVEAIFSDAAKAEAYLAKLVRHDPSLDGVRVKEYTLDEMDGAVPTTMHFARLFADGSVEPGGFTNTELVPPGATKVSMHRDAWTSAGEALHPRRLIATVEAGSPEAAREVAAEVYRRWLKETPDARRPIHAPAQSGIAPRDRRRREPDAALDPASDAADEASRRGDITPERIDEAVREFRARSPYDARGD